MKNILVLTLALMLTFTLAACSGNGSRAAGGMPEPAAKMPGERGQTLELAQIEPKAASPAKSPEVFDMKIRLLFGNMVLTATMLDTETSRNFISQLPLTLTFEDYAGTEKISYLSNRLSTQDAPSGSDPSVGDLTYYAPWGNLAIFYKDFGYSSGLVRLGTIDSDIEKLAGMNGKFTVKIERMD